MTSVVLRILAFLPVLLLIALLAGPLATTAPTPVNFTERAARSGLHFHYNNGASGKRYLPETMGAGCAFIDLDGDGWQDILLLNGRDFVPHATRSLPALYRNNKDSTFTDITKGSGLDIELYAMGVAVADFDNDGLPDIYITALEGDRLFHNEGHGHFKDVTATSGIRNADFGTSAAWLDYDHDGKADLFVANYTSWSMKKDTWCSLDGTSKSYCTPEKYSGTSSKLYRNLGSGKFQDVTDKAGLGDKTSKSLGVATVDFDGDTWTDLFVTNDTQPNKLYRNNGNGTFTEVGMQAGVAYAEDGVARGAMGVDAADYDNSGRPHLLVGNFANQMLGLYHNEGKGIFIDQAPSSNVGRDTRLSLTFGAFFFDFDLDGLPDIFAVNGHIEPDIAKVQPAMHFRQAPQLFRNVGNGHNRYQFICAQDLADAACRAINHRSSAVMNIGSDNVKSLREIYNYVIEKANSSSKVASLPERLSLGAMRLAHLLELSPLGPYHYKMIAEDFIFDTAKIKKELDWQPTLTNEEMLWRAYSYYADNYDEITSRIDVWAHKQPAKMGVIAS